MGEIRDAFFGATFFLVRVLISFFAGRGLLPWSLLFVSGEETKHWAISDDLTHVIAVTIARASSSSPCARDN